MLSVSTDGNELFSRKGLTMGAGIPFLGGMRRLLIIEPYFGTSHAHLIRGLMERLDCECELLEMSPRKWKWRMRGGAIHLAGMAGEIVPCDAIFASDFLDLPAFLALGSDWLRDCRKTVYFHENQITYPVRVNDERDFHFGLTNITTALSADAVAFNSDFHKWEFLGAMEELISKFPDYRPKGLAEAIAEKSSVLPIPLDLDTIPTGHNRTGPLRILWNQRWEFDKAPEVLFEALFDLDESGVDFELIVAGEGFEYYPPIFDEARERLAHRIVHWGFVDSRQEYLRLLGDCDVVVSTAIHEFFGIAVAEAVAGGCRPLLPNRLAYSDMYPPEFLYDNDSDFREQLRRMCFNPELARTDDYRGLVSHLDWSEQIGKYEKFIFN